MNANRECGKVRLPRENRGYCFLIPDALDHGRDVSSVSHPRSRLPTAGEPRSSNVRLKCWGRPGKSGTQAYNYTT